MSHAQPALVVSLYADGRAAALLDGRVQDIALTALHGCAGPGDWVLVQAGSAVSRLATAQATGLLALLYEAESVTP